MDTATDHSFGVFKPVGHIVISFPSRDQAAAARTMIAGLGLQDGEVRPYSDTEMLAQIDADLRRASPVAAVGQELNLIKAHRELAERGFHWIVVRAVDDDIARRIADAAREHGAERAQYYGRFIIEELSPSATALPQVAESPDRGLDAQTRSGTEAERADLARPAPPKA